MIVDDCDRWWIEYVVTRKTLQRLRFVLTGLRKNISRASPFRISPNWYNETHLSSPENFFFFYWLWSFVVTVLINLTIYWGHCPCLLNYSLQTGVLCCLQHHTTHGLGISLTASNCASPQIKSTPTPTMPLTDAVCDPSLTKNVKPQQSLTHSFQSSSRTHSSKIPFLAKNCGAEFFSCCTYRLSVPSTA